MREPGLFLREWVAIAVIGGFVLSILAVSWISQAPVKHQFVTQKTSYRESLIEVCVEGAVKKPGVYQFTPGTSVKEVLHLAGLQSQADRKRINFKRKILSPAHIEVPAKEAQTKKRRGERENKGSGREKA